MIGLQRALVLLALLGAFLIGIGVLLAASSDHIERRAVAAAIVGALVMASYIGVGLYAWWRRPSNRVGPLMAAVGYAFFPALSTSNAPAVLLDRPRVRQRSTSSSPCTCCSRSRPGAIPTRTQRNIIVAAYARR